MSCCEDISIKQVLIPLNLLSLAALLFFGMQLTLVLKDRDVLHETLGQQERPYAESQKLQAQLSALLVGAQKLADSGDANVKPILAKLKEMGIAVNVNPQASAPEGAPKAGQPLPNGVNPPSPMGPVPTGAPGVDKH